MREQGSLIRRVLTYSYLINPSIFSHEFGINVFRLHGAPSSSTKRSATSLNMRDFRGKCEKRRFSVEEESYTNRDYYLRMIAASDCGFFAAVKMENGEIASYQGIVRDDVRYFFCSAVRKVSPFKKLKVKFERSHIIGHSIVKIIKRP